MNSIVYLSLFILTILITLGYIAIKEIKNRDGYHRHERELYDNLRGYYETLKRNLDENPHSYTENRRTNIPRIIREIDLFKDNIQSLERRKRNFTKSIKWIIFRTKLIWFGGFLLFFLSYLSYLDFLISALGLLFRFAWSSNFFLIFFISSSLSFIFVRGFTRLPKAFNPEAQDRSFKDSIVLKIQEVKEPLEVVESSLAKEKFVEPFSFLGHPIIRILPKVLILLLFLLSLYYLTLSVIQYSEENFLHILNIFILVLILIGFFSSLIKGINVKFDNFSIYFLILSIFWMWQIRESLNIWLNIGILILSSVIVVLIVFFSIKNQKLRVQERDNNKRAITRYFYRSLFVIVPQLYLVVDIRLVIISLFHFSSGFNIFLLVSIIYLLTSTKSIIGFLRNYNNVFNRIQKCRVNKMLLNSLNLFLFAVMFNVVSSQDVISFIFPILIPHDLVQLLIFFWTRIQKRTPSSVVYNIKSSQCNKKRSLKSLVPSIDSLSEPFEREVKKESSNYCVARQSELKHSIWDEKINVEILSRIKTEIDTVLRKKNFKFLTSDVLNDQGSTINNNRTAVVSFTIDERVKLILVLNIGVVNLKGNILVLEDKFYYRQFNQKLKIDNNKDTIIVPLDTFVFTFNNEFVLYEIQHNDILLKKMADLLDTNLELEKTITGNPLFFHDGDINTKIIVENILISPDSTLNESEKFQFPYIKTNNTYCINNSDLIPLLDYISDKYVKIEKLNHRKNTLSNFWAKSETIARKMRRTLIYVVIIVTLAIGLHYFLIIFNNQIALSILPRLLALSNIFCWTLLIFRWLQARRLMIKLVIDSIIPYQDLPFCITSKEYKLLKSAFSAELFAQFSYEMFN